MKTGRFFHRVSIEIELTGLDLVILEYHAKQHYDGTCQRFFEPAHHPRDANHDGYGWLGEWQWRDWEARFADVDGKTIEPGEYRHPSENLDFAVKVRATSDALDLCMKIIERLGADETWEMVEKLTGKKMPPIEQKMGQLVPPLRASIKDAFFKIRDEWERLDEQAKPAPEFEGHLLCPHCKSDEVEWQEYVLSTRQILGVVDGEICVDIATEKSEFECSKDEQLACRACYAEFKVPGGLSIDHVEEKDYEARKAAAS